MPIDSPWFGRNPSEQPAAIHFLNDTAISPTLDSLRILLVEDEEILRNLVAGHLTKAGFKVLLAPAAEEGFRRATRENPDLVLLDWMMPGQTGDVLCKRLRAHGVTCPIVMLTSNNDPVSQVAVLEGGADDYWVKPVPLNVLVARINALLRRQVRQERTSQTWEHDGLRIDLSRHAVTLRGESVELGSKELGILETLLLAGGVPVSRDQLLTSVWHYDHAPDTRTVDNYVMTLRRKLEADPLNPRYVLTVRGVGYRLNLDLFASADPAKTKA